jgi:thiol-disulfide isomerase/thioredoxin
MMQLRKSLLLFVIVIGGACTLVAQQWTIKANLTGFPGNAKFYLVDADLNSNVDSANLKNGRLQLKGHQVNPPTVYWLTTTIDKKFYYTILLFGNESIAIKGDKSQFPFELSIVGSKSQDDLNMQTSQSVSYYKYRDSATKLMMTFTGPDADRKRDSVWSLVRIQDSLNGVKTIKFINDHINTYAALSALFFVRENYSNDSLRNLLNRLSPAMRASTFAKRIENYLNVGTPLQAGDNMHDFIALDSSGKQHRASEFNGKYILLDFSSTYCGPCMASIPELKTQKIKYSNDLVIISVSADMSRDVWLKGLLRDQPNWLSLWDGRGAYSETMMKYGVQGFPTFCLINPEGKIANISIGYGKDENGKGSIETLLSKYIKLN